MFLRNSYRSLSEDIQTVIDSLQYFQGSTLDKSFVDLAEKIASLESCIIYKEEKRQKCLVNKPQNECFQQEEQSSPDLQRQLRFALLLRHARRIGKTLIKDESQDYITFLPFYNSGTDLFMLDNQKDALQVNNEKSGRKLLQENVIEEQQQLRQQRTLQTYSQMAKLQGQLTGLVEVDGLPATEKEQLQQCVDHLHSNVMDHNNSMTQLMLKQNHSRPVSTSTMLSNSHDNDRVAREKLHAELTRLKEMNCSLATEKAKLEQCVDDLHSENKNDKKAMQQVIDEQNLHNSMLEAKSAMLSDLLNQERVAKGKLRAEVTRLMEVNGLLTSEKETLQQRVDDLHSTKTDQQNIHNRMLLSESTMLLATTESLMTRLQISTVQLEDQQARHYLERCQNIGKEVANLKSYLKMGKKDLKKSMEKHLEDANKEFKQMNTNNKNTKQNDKKKSKFWQKKQAGEKQAGEKQLDTAPNDQIRPSSRSDSKADKRGLSSKLFCCLF